MNTSGSVNIADFNFGKLSKKILLTLLFIIAASLVFLAGQWALNSALLTQTDAIRRAIDLNTLGLRAETAKYSALPYAATLQPDVIAALTKDDPNLRQRANVYLADVNQRVGSDAFYIMDLKGITIAASNWGSAKTFIGQNYANRPYFIDALKGKTSMFYGIGQTTAIPGLFIGTPAYQHGKVIGVVVIKVSLREIEIAWSESNAPIMLSDTNGIFFLGSVPAWKYQTKNIVESDSLEGVQLHKQYGEKRVFPQVPWLVKQLNANTGYLIETQLKGKQQSYLAYDQHLPEFGWKLTVMGDYKPVLWARVSALIFGALGIGLLVLVLLYWQLRENRLAEQSNARRELEARVTERTQELGESLAFQQAMENSLLVGMRARDLSGRIIYVNAAFCDMTGFSANTLIGSLPPYPYWHQDDLTRHWKDNKTVLSGNADLKGFESRIRHSDGYDVHTVVYTAPLIDATGKQKGWMSSVVDITGYKEAESKQRLLDSQLQHATRLASMGELATTLAHELNQPLMALNNYSSAARAFAAQGNQTLLIESLQEITLQSQRSADIVRRIRGFVKPISTGVQFCSINTIVNNVLALLKFEMKRSQTALVCRLTENLPSVCVDRLLIEQVILNLVMNGLQAMQKKPVELRCIEIETLLADASICVKIFDCGTGISKAIEPKIFDPFFTTKTDGLGLGLNICRTIIESHQGELKFENRASEINQGAVFSIKLPVKYGP